VTRPIVSAILSASRAVPTLTPAATSRRSAQPGGPPPRLFNFALRRLAGNALGHRRASFRRKLGPDSIRAEIVDEPAADATLLAELDENLVRAELTPAERAMHVGKRKELYEKLHPETKPTKTGGPGRAKTRRKVCDDTADRFTKDAAKKTGKSERAIQLDAARANKIVVLSDVAGTSLDTGEELDALAKLPEAEQRKLADRAVNGEKVSAKTRAKQVRREEREIELAGRQCALPDQKFGVILEDFEWDYEVRSRETGACRARLRLWARPGHSSVYPGPRRLRIRSIIQ
jgi:hypothetical protein